MKSLINTINREADNTEPCQTTGETFEDSLDSYCIVYKQKFAQSQHLYIKDQKIVLTANDTLLHLCPINCRHGAFGMGT